MTSTTMTTINANNTHTRIYEWIICLNLSISVEIFSFAHAYLHMINKMSVKQRLNDKNSLANDLKWFLSASLASPALFALLLGNI